MTLTIRQMAVAFELKSKGLYWHEVARRLRVYEKQLVADVAKAKREGFGAWSCNT